MTDPHAQELSRLRIKAGLPVRMTHEEAVNWIAFRQMSAADLTGKAEFGAKWVAAYAEGSIRYPEPSEDGSDCSVLRALRALAEGVPVWTPNTHRDPGWQAYVRAYPDADFVPPAFLEIKHAAEHLVEKFGRSAAVLAAEMQADLDAYAKRKAQVDAAERDLDAAQVDGLLRVEGRWPTREFKGVSIIELWPALDQAAAKSRRENLKHDWSEIEKLLAERFDADGMPAWEHERGAKARWERWIAERFSVDQQPSESQIRLFLNQQIDAYRRRVG